MVGVVGVPTRGHAGGEVVGAPCEADAPVSCARGGGVDHVVHRLGIELAARIKGFTPGEGQITAAEILADFPEGLDVIITREAPNYRLE